MIKNATLASLSWPLAHSVFSAAQEADSQLEHEAACRSLLLHPYFEGASSPSPRS